MPRKLTKTKKQIPNTDSNVVESTENTTNKENVNSIQRIRKKLAQKEKLELSSQPNDDFRKPLGVTQNPEALPKEKGFWSIKLKNLEPDKSILKEKKSGLYEFSISDKSSSIKLKKKKPRKRPVKQNKKELPMFSCASNKMATKLLKPRSKIDEEHRKSLVREQIMLNRERENLADKNDKFTFSTLIPCIGVTSTPAVPKVNLVGASNFMFLSPVERSVDFLNHDIMYDTPVKSSRFSEENVYPQIKTPKLETRVEKVLRNRRVVV